MKKRFIIMMTIISVMMSFTHFYLRSKALEYVAPATAAFDSIAAAYAATKGMQLGTTAAEPTIIGDYTQPYTYANGSMTALQPLWNEFSNRYVRDKWQQLFPYAQTYDDALSIWARDKSAFMLGIDAGFFIREGTGQYAFQVFDEWINSLSGTEYVKSGGEPVYLSLGDTITFYGNLTKYSNGVYTQSPQGLELSVEWEGYNVIGANQFVLNTGTSPVGFVCYQEINNPSVYRTRRVDMGYQQGWRDDGYWYSTPTGITLGIEITSSQWFSQFDTLSNVGQIFTNNGEPVPADKSDIPITTEEVKTDVMTQMNIGDPNDHDNKDNKKLTVLPNVPGLSQLDPLQLPGVNGGRLPFNFPSPDASGNYPPISVKGNGGVVINIPVTNNNYEVINNYDQHEEIYNNNQQYPTINYNYVNYYVNQGAMTYEQFLQALQEYFNVIVYNNENNYYYPTTINETTNNYYNITEVINDRIPPILPPSTISIADRFPFSIPFDLYKILVLFNAEPHYWEWDVPVPTFQSGGTSNEFYHGEVGHFDFSSTVHISLERWDIVALVLRTMLSILWSSFLYFLFWKWTHH